ncbi:hypothetical protein [Micromonospora siamensis]|uniref:Taurine catabolism dioxygenase TauD, TfdA family n=1 Tax=Micromonospora siamensis TaxID=299152 RepID=A0A1C5HWW2_9ACTN|nr:hypothetical protein [Micromonospora siamensis]SCG50479.1 hypothetical protein GA0074704_2500 [Micromonospora siamensis]
MRFTPAQLHLDCTHLIEGDQRERADARDALAATAAQLITEHGYVIFRLGRLRLDGEESRRLAVELSEALRVALVRRGAPSVMRLEQDKEQQTYVPEGFGSRTLLPHHDGQHCSYLTPSTADDPDWTPAGRQFGDRGYTTTPAHKMYQGVFMADPGDGLSVTTYYDWLDLLGTVHRERAADEGSGDARSLARWLGDNLRAALARQPEHGCAYPSVGAMLGLGEPIWHGLSFHHAEAPLTDGDRARYPLAGPLARRCACGECVGDTARLFCHQLLTATGRTWRDCRRRWEVLAPSERYDLLFGHNLTMLHGGLAGGAGRVIGPFCLVVDEPSGAEYERWLAAAWRRSLPAAR